MWPSIFGGIALGASFIGGLSQAVGKPTPREWVEIGMASWFVAGLAFGIALTLIVT